MLCEAARYCKRLSRALDLAGFFESSRCSGVASCVALGYCMNLELGDYVTKAMAETTYTGKHSGTAAKAIAR